MRGRVNVPCSAHHVKDAPAMYGSRFECKENYSNRAHAENKGSVFAIKKQGQQNAETHENQTSKCQAQCERESLRERVVIASDPRE